MKKSVQQEYWTLVNIYLPNKCAHEHIKQILKDIKGEIHNNTIIVGDFTSMDISRQKINIESLALLLLLSPFSRVQPCVTPEMAAHQAPPSLGFSRQEHWSGLSFPSPTHESEKWKQSLSRVWLLATPWTAAYQAPPSMGFSRQEYWRAVPLPSP